MTIRNILIDNLRENKQPNTVNQLAQASEVHRVTISKMQNGDYSNVHFESIRRVFAALGYEVDIEVKKLEA